MAANHDQKVKPPPRAPESRVGQGNGIADSHQPAASFVVGQFGIRRAESTMRSRFSANRWNAVIVPVRPLISRLSKVRHPVAAICDSRRALL
jgi:hypothetical protein